MPHFSLAPPRGLANARKSQIGLDFAVFLNFHAVSQSHRRLTHSRSPSVCTPPATLLQPQAAAPLFRAVARSLSDRMAANRVAEMSSTKKASGKTQRSAIADVVAREYTIHLHKRVC
jgi:hypothetical protein